MNTVGTPPALQGEGVSRFIQKRNETQFAFNRLGLIVESRIAPPAQEKIYPENFDRFFRAKRLTVTNPDQGDKTMKINGLTTFYRPGSPKTRGWQITIRGSFKNFVERESENGYLFINRGGGYLIPMSFLREKFGPLMRNQDTLDIFVNFDSDGRDIIYCRGQEFDITEFRLS